MSATLVDGLPAHIYRMAPWARVLLVVVGLAMLAPAPLFLLLSAQAGGGLAVATPLLVLLGVLALLGAYLLAAALRTGVVLTPDAIEVHGVWRVRRMARADIAGRRLLQLNYGQTLTQLLPRTEDIKALKFSPSSLRTDAAFDAWMRSIPDLDAQEAKAYEAEITADAELGQTPQERLARVASARKFARMFNGGAWAIMLWSFVYPQPYGLLLLGLAALPWVAVALVAKSRGLYRLDVRRNDVRPNLAAAVYLPGFALLLRAVEDVGVLDWQRALSYALLTTAVLAAAALRSDDAVRARVATAATLCALLCAYGYGAVVLANSQLDGAMGNEYRVNVLARHVSRGSKSTTWYLTLAPWGPRPRPEDVTVTRALYEASPPGASVCVHQGPGALGIAWYIVRGCG